MMDRVFIAAASGFVAAAVCNALAEFPDPLEPAEAEEAMATAEGLAAEIVLSEPEIVQPVFANFDERGRLWVVQYIQYPEPAGLTMRSRDRFWRAVYDEAPPPPPHDEDSPFRGRDRITIHEDTNGDGAFDSHQVFLDGLNIVTAVERGRGGVWVLNPPYLLFYPTDLETDEILGEPEVHLEGFWLEDTHSVVNSLRWGPDGWLYAAQGSTVSADVRKPGSSEAAVHSMGQLIWRYHPETRRYEIFAEGGGNAFGVEIDRKGRVFSGHNGGNTRGFHYVQGGYLQKGFNKHGNLSNPYAFGYFPQMPHEPVQRFTHNFVIYEGGAFPERYDGLLVGIAPLLNHVVMAERIADGSTFRTEDVGYAMETEDAWFRPVDIKLGPDGAVYVMDWYEAQTSHIRNHEGDIDKTRGRIWRLRSEEAEAMEPFDLNAKTSAELVALLRHENRWMRETARRVLGDRRDESVIPTLRRMVREESGQLALEALWALHVSGGLDEARTVAALAHDDPYVRLWAARLACDERQVSERVAGELVDLAERETEAEVRSQLASSARRLNAAHGLAIVEKLLRHGEDVEDRYIPLLLWWAIEDKADAEREAVLAMFEDASLWAEPLVERHILERLMRRYAATGRRGDLQTAARLMRMAPGEDHRQLLVNGFERAYAGRSLAEVPDELAEALAELGGGSLVIRLRQGEAEAVAEALALVVDEAAPMEDRVQVAAVLGEVRVAEAVEPLKRIVGRANDPELLTAALTALRRYEEGAIAGIVLDRYDQFSAEVRAVAQTLLASRAAWSRQFLEAIEAGRVDRAAVPMELVEAIRLHDDSRVRQLAESIWPAVADRSSEELDEEIGRLARVIREGPGEPSPGRQVYLARCAACHRLFDEGGTLGPDLTAYQRDDLNSMLLSIVNPNAELREGYEGYIATTTDGRVVTGFLADEDEAVVVLRGMDGQNTVIEREDLAELQPMPRSLMPEGLLRGLSEQELRDLFAYLRSSQPLAE